MSDTQIRVTVWNENIAEREDPNATAVYPSGMHQVIAEGLEEHLGDAVKVRTATLDQSDQGLSDEILEETDVLTWWGHLGHELVSDDLVDRVQQRVLDGMGLLVLHSGHESKVFKRLLGTHCSLQWRDGEDSENVWVIKPAHPIAQNIPQVFVVPKQEMYGEYFDIPAPDDLVFLSTFTGGEVFRSGCCFYRGKGRIFYFGPGHETHPVYYQHEIRQVLANGVRWAFSETQLPLETKLGIERQVGWHENVEVR